MPTAKRTRKTAASATKQKHKHRLPGKGTSKADGNLGSLLGTIKKKGKAKPKKKSDKPLFILEGQAQNLLDLQQAKAQMKVLEGSIQELEADLLPECEAGRTSINRAAQEYVGSIHIQATGEDDDGNPIEAGQAVYYIKYGYSAFDPSDVSTDEELQEQMDGEATLRDEAVAAIANKLDVEWDEAEQLLDDRMVTDTTIALEKGALQNPDVIKILQKHLAEHLVSTTKMKPNKAFHERASFNAKEAEIMEAINEIGLCPRYKGVLNPSGAPKAPKKAVKTR
jgi:hypothetical protein